MNFAVIPRADAGLRAPVAPLTPFQTVDGIIVHYVGGGAMPLNPTLDQSKAAWRQIQEEALANHKEGYIDVQYNHAIDPVGRILEGRGFRNKSGANGSPGYNGHALAVCYLAGVNQPITNAARDALVWYSHEAVRNWGAISYVKPHSGVYNTACPGDAVRTFVPEMQARLHETDGAPPPPPAPTPVVPSTGGKIIDLSHCHAATIPMKGYGYGQFVGVYDAKVPLEACQATVLGPAPHAAVPDSHDDLWEFSRGATVRCQVRGTRVVVVVECPHYKNGMATPMAHVLAVPA